MHFTKTNIFMGMKADLLEAYDLSHHADFAEARGQRPAAARQDEGGAVGPATEDQTAERSGKGTPKPNRLEGE